MLDLCSLLSSSGREGEALEQFNSNVNLSAITTPLGYADSGNEGKSHGFGALLAASALTPVHLMLRLGELQAARQLLTDNLPSSSHQEGPGNVRAVKVRILVSFASIKFIGPRRTSIISLGEYKTNLSALNLQLPPGSVASALALQAEVALGLMSREVADGGGDAAEIKRLALEARWSAAGSLRELQGSSEWLAGGRKGKATASAYWLLGRAELARGKADKAAEALAKV